MQKRNFRSCVSSALGMMFVALVAVLFVACNEGSKHYGSAPAAEKTPVVDIKTNVDTLIATFTVVGEPDAVGHIGVKATVDAGADHAIGEADKAITWEPVADMAQDGLKYSRNFKSQYGHVVTTSATLDKATVDFGDYTGRVLLTGVELKPIAVGDNVELTPAEGERERMLTPVQAIWTGVVRIDGQRGEKSFELNPTDGVIRWIAEDAPTIKDYEITPSENRTINSWNGDVLITAVMSDGSKVEVGNDPVALAESWICTSNWSVTVSKAEQTTGKLNKISSTSDSFRKDGIRGYYTGKIITETWESLVNVNGKQVKNVFVAKYVSNVEYHMFDRDEKASFKNATSSASIDAGTITNNSLYAAIGTNKVGEVSRTATAPGTITVDKVIVKHYWDTKTQEDVLTEAARDCSADYVREYSDGTVDRHNYTFHYNRAKSAGSYFEVWPEAAEDNLGNVTTSESASSKTDAHVKFNLRAFKVSVPVQIPGNAQTDVATFTEAEDIIFSVTVNGEKDELKFNNPSHSASASKKELQKIGEDEEVTTYFHSADLTWNYGNTTKSVTCTGKIFIHTGHGGGEPDPDAPKSVIGGGIVSPEQGLTDNMWYVGYLLLCNDGSVRPLIVDKNGQNVVVGEKFTKNAAWNGACRINGKLYPVKGSDMNGMLTYSHSAGLKYQLSAVNAGDGFNWNHATVQNVTGHYKPVITQENGKTVLRLSGVSNWSKSEWD